MPDFCWFICWSKSEVRKAEVNISTTVDFSVPERVNQWLQGLLGKVEGKKRKNFIRAFLEINAKVTWQSYPPALFVIQLIRASLMGSWVCTDSYLLTCQHSLLQTETLFS